MHYITLQQTETILRSMYFDIMFFAFFVRHISSLVLLFNMCRCFSDLNSDFRLVFRWNEKENKESYNILGNLKYILRFGKFQIYALHIINIRRQRWFGVNKAKLNTEGEDNVNLCVYMNIFGTISFVYLFTFYKYCYFLIEATQEQKREGEREREEEEECVLINSFGWKNAGKSRKPIRKVFFSIISWRQAMSNNNISGEIQIICFIFSLSIIPTTQLSKLESLPYMITNKH